MCYSVQVKLKDFEEGIGEPIDFESWADVEKKQIQNPKFYKLPDTNGRIFPNTFAPVLVAQAKHQSLLPMRYQMWPKNFPIDPQYLSLFNARYDNLTKAHGVWHNVFGKKHGIIVIERFYEWVAVRDLVQAGHVTLAAVKAEFARQELKRKKAALAKGKPYKPTKTSQLDAMERKIEITFSPVQTKRIIAPILYDEHKLNDGTALKSFALITDAPPSEVAAAGHDRSPIFLNASAVEAWLHPAHHSPRDLLEVLQQREDIHYEHQLAHAA